MRTAIFVDGSNFSAACNLAGFRPDFDKIISYFKREGDVVGAYYFTALPPREIETNLRRLTDRLDYNGWSVVSKEAKTYHDGAGTPVVKGNMDCDMIVYGYEMCEYITDLVLFTGDGDFTSAVKSWQKRGLRITAVSTLSRESSENMMSDDLRRAVNRFIDLKDMREFISLEVQSQPSEPKPKMDFLRRRT